MVLLVLWSKYFMVASIKYKISNINDLSIIEQVSTFIYPFLFDSINVLLAILLKCYKYIFYLQIVYAKTNERQKANSKNKNESISYSLNSFQWLAMTYVVLNRCTKCCDPYKLINTRWTRNKISCHTICMGYYNE